MADTHPWVNVFAKVDSILARADIWAETFNSPSGPPSRTDGRTVEFNVAKCAVYTPRDLYTTTALNYHELAHILFTPRNMHTWPGAIAVHTYLNLLEDHRIEHLLLGRFPSTRPYLVGMIERYILGPKADITTVWPLVAGRWYLPKEVREVCRDEWVGGPKSAGKIETLILSYRNNEWTAPNHVPQQEREDAVWVATELQKLIQRALKKDIGSDCENNMTEGSPASPTMIEQAQEWADYYEEEETDAEELEAESQGAADLAADYPEPTAEELADESLEDDDDTDGPGAGSDDTDATEDGSQDGGDAEDSGDFDADADDNAGGSADTDEDADDDSAEGGSGDGADTDDDGADGDGSGSGDADSDGADSGDASDTDGAGEGIGTGYQDARTPQERVQDAIRDAIDNAMSSNDVQEELDRTGTSIRQAVANSIALTRVDQVRHTATPDMMFAANRLRRVFEQAEVDSDPGWETRRDAGRLSIKAVMQDLPYDQVWDEWQADHTSITDFEVVVLMDVSASMRYGKDETAGRVLWIVRQGLQSVGATVRVIGFGHDAVLAADEGEMPNDLEYDVLVSDHASTMPVKATREARRVLVNSTRKVKVFICVTDGAFSPQERAPFVSEVAAMNNDDIHTVVVGIGYTLENSYGASAIANVGDDVDALVAVFETMVLNIKRKVEGQ